ncbi:hypothetical protein [Kozakia baliensis]|uniref:hypothetical protein n=1 Tax=Kozakia baliensis TaxID=153496 RepID=UPI0004977F55|nr:hypothetical protein [Kozakia baliensis]
MTKLTFEDRGWNVVTSVWTVGAKEPDRISICYMWGSDGISFFDSATGTARVEFLISFSDFMRRVREAGPDGIVEL